MDKQAWRAVILLNYPDDAHREQGRSDIAEIAKLDPPITDLDTLELLHSSLREIPGFEDTVRTLWEKAAKAKPHDVEIQSAWFSRAFDAGDWKAAQKVRTSYTRTVWNCKRRKELTVRPGRDESSS